MSQFEGFFGQLSFQTSNFMGRGEALTVSLQVGSRSENYQVAFSEPFLFDRNITGGIDVYKRTLRYIDQFTQEATGGNVTGGFPLAGFSRMFVQYSYEAVTVSDLNPVFYAPELVQRNPYLRDSLLLGQGGQRTISKVTPSFVHNTVDNPIFPNSGKRLGVDGFRRHRGQHQLPQAAFGVRAVQAAQPPHVGRLSRTGGIHRPPMRRRRRCRSPRRSIWVASTIRGFDIRSIGPRDPEGTGLVLGGNKTLLFNAEYLINIAGPVRLVLFYDTGQVRDIGQRFAWREDVTQTVDPGLPMLLDPDSTTRRVDPNAPPSPRPAFKTSTGAEVRFFMPVLNVPFRSSPTTRNGSVLDNSLRPAKIRSSSPSGRLFNMQATEGADGAEKFMMLRVLIAALAMTASACSGLIDEFRRHRIR